ncbi:MAG: YfhO family protein, partial [Clostridia bacterium]|nr:YfhO family protein [Clostridia bacterium]
MKQKIKTWAFDWRYIFLAFGTSFGIMLLVAFCYDMVPFGDITILRMDMYHQYGPLLAELYDRITHAESLIYSWTSGG